MSSADQIQRLLAMVPLLQMEELTVSDLATHFGCSRAQIMKDLNLLWLVGPSMYYSSSIDINIDAVKDDHDQIVKLSNADYLRRPMRLSRAEAGALLVALELIRTDSPNPAVDSTIRKIRAVCDEMGPQAQVLSQSNEPQLVGELNRAIGEDQAVWLSYFVPSRDETTERLVEPIEVFHEGGHSYLDAWCRQAGGRRIFRLNRINEITGSAEPRLGADLKPRNHDESPVIDSAEWPEARIQLDADAAWFRDYHPVLSSEWESPETLLVKMPLVNSEWLLREIASLGGRGRVVSPPALADRLREHVLRARALYQAMGANMDSRESADPQFPKGNS